MTKYNLTKTSAHSVQFNRNTVDEWFERNKEEIARVCNLQLRPETRNQQNAPRSFYRMEGRMFENTNPLFTKAHQISEGITLHSKYTGVDYHAQIFIGYSEEVGDMKGAYSTYINLDGVAQPRITINAAAIHSLDAVKYYVVHELTHYFDPKMQSDELHKKQKEKFPNEEDYYETPTEYDAFSHQFVSMVESNIKKHPEALKSALNEIKKNIFDPNLLGRETGVFDRPSLGVEIPDALTLIMHFKQAWDGWTPEQQKRFKLRLYTALSALGEPQKKSRFLQRKDDLARIQEQKLLQEKEEEEETRKLFEAAGYRGDTKNFLEIE